MSRFAVIVLAVVALGGVVAARAYYEPPHEESPGTTTPAATTTTTTAATTALPRLLARVGPGATITLTTAAGRRVRTAKPGRYRIAVRDLTRRDNFHLRGPGVNRSTGIAFRGSATWPVTLRAGGTYRYVSDARPARLRGSFTVTGGRRLVATVGPGFTIVVRTAAGTRVRTLEAGVYTIVVRDRSGIHNFNLRGPRVSRRTGIAFVGTVTWRLRLRPGLYRFLCEPHSGDMHGGFRVR